MCGRFKNSCAQKTAYTAQQHTEDLNPTKLHATSCNCHRHLCYGSTSPLSLRTPSHSFNIVTFGASKDLRATAGRETARNPGQAEGHRKASGAGAGLSCAGVEGFRLLREFQS